MVKHEIHITIMVTLLAFLFLCLWRPLPSSSLIGHDVQQIFISSCHKLLELFIPRVPPKQSQFQETRSLKNFIPLGYGARMSKEAALENLRSGKSEFCIFPHGVLPVPPKTVSQSHQPVSCVELTGNALQNSGPESNMVKFRVKYGEILEHVKGLKSKLVESYGHPASSDFICIFVACCCGFHVSCWFQCCSCK